LLSFLLMAHHCEIYILARGIRSWFMNRSFSSLAKHIGILLSLIILYLNVHLRHVKENSYILGPITITMFEASDKNILLAWNAKRLITTKNGAEYIYGRKMWSCGDKLQWLLDMFITYNKVIVYALQDRVSTRINCQWPILYPRKISINKFVHWWTKKL